jgi:hypothetical protein
MKFGIYVRQSTNYMLRKLQSDWITISRLIGIVTLVLLNISMRGDFSVKSTTSSYRIYLKFYTMVLSYREVTMQNYRSR